MDKFLKPTFNKIITKDVEENITTFTLEKLERGFGNTIGTALRRAIISSVPGASMFAVEIKGVSHEYQAIKDCSQDAVELVLNLKELVIELDETAVDKEEIFELKLVSKAGTVKGSDIETPNGITIVNKNIVIAETTKDKAIDMTIYVAFSRGFKSFQETRGMVEELLGNKRGIIPTDANYSPIKRVNLKIEEVNPGEVYVYERLVLEVETKGNIAAEKAVAYAASVLTNYYSAFNELNIVNADADFIEEAEEIEEDGTLSTTINQLNLSTRSENALKLAKLDTVEQIIELTLSQLKSLDNLGEKSVLEIIDTIQELGLSFKSE
jgi:DNA-directed RNA polymerase subunit alpha